MGSRREGMSKEDVEKLEAMKEPYNYVLGKDEKRFKAYFEDKKERLRWIIDVSQNTPIHYAALHGDFNIFKSLFDLLSPEDKFDILRSQNVFGNTPLHEVALKGNVKIAEEMLKCCNDIYDRQEPDCSGTYSTDSSTYIHEEVHHGNNERFLVDMMNCMGETPLYRAAAYGRTKLVRFLIEHKKKYNCGLDLKQHFVKKDGLSILDIAVITLNFATAIWLVDKYPCLAEPREESEMTSFQLLAKMPYAFKSQPNITYLRKFFHWVLPDPAKWEDADSDDLHKSVVWKLCYYIWKIPCIVCEDLTKVWEEKKRFVLAEKLVDILAKHDYSWAEKTYNGLPGTITLGQREVGPQAADHEENENASHQKEGTKSTSNTSKSKCDIPLFLAAGNGIVEIVKKIHEEHPHAIQYVNEEEQNILYIAFKHRQQSIYDYLETNIRRIRLFAVRIDKDGNTIFHHAASIAHRSRPQATGNAFQLQDELRWYERAREMIPPHYILRRNNKHETAEDVLGREHHDMVENGRKWAKETAQSCSTIAVLVASIVVSAAYQLPGGFNKKGKPNLIDSPIFYLFTYMNVTSLASSLCSLVVFLSILSSPLDLQSFRRAIPDRLIAGFVLLFFSLCTTVVAFSATVILNIDWKASHWTQTCVYIAAMIPVAAIGFIQFPLLAPMKRSYNTIKNFILLQASRWFQSLE